MNKGDIVNKKYKKIFLIIILILALFFVFIYKYNGDLLREIFDYFNVIDLKNNDDNEEAELVVTVINVGHGDSLLIKSVDDENKNHFCLVDTGSGRYSQNVIECLDRNKVKNLDFIMISHTHSDHMGSLSGILKSKSSNEIIVPNYFKVKEKILSNNKIRTLVKENKIKIKNVKPDQKIFIGKAYFNVLYPIIEKKQKLPKDLNDSSIVGILNYDNFKMMFTGDATSKIEKIILNNYKPDELKCDILKLAHHGSSTSSSLNFLKVVNPRYAVISSGDDKDIIYPHPSVKERLENLNVDYYNTKAEGDIVISVINNKCKIKTQN